MTSVEYNARREQYRAKWAEDDRRKRDDAVRRLRRFVVFVAVMVVVSAGLGAVMH